MLTVRLLDSIRTASPQQHSRRRGRGGKSCACGAVQLKLSGELACGAEHLGLWEEGATTHHFCRVCGAHMRLAANAPESAVADACAKGIDDGKDPLCKEPPCTLLADAPSSATAIVASPSARGVDAVVAAAPMEKLASSLTALHQCDSAMAAAFVTPPRPPSRSCSADTAHCCTPPAPAAAPAPAAKVVSLDVDAGLQRAKRHLDKYRVLNADAEHISLR